MTRIGHIKAPINPYLEEERKRQLDVLETVPEEMLLFQEYDDNNDLNINNSNGNQQRQQNTPSGISYKDKLRTELQRRRNNNRNDNNNHHNEGYYYK